MTPITMFIRRAEFACRIDVSGIKSSNFAHFFKDVVHFRANIYFLCTFVLICGNFVGTVYRFLTYRQINTRATVTGACASSTQPIFLGKTGDFNHFQVTMFKFGFSQDKPAEDEGTSEIVNLNWFPATEIEISDEENFRDFEDEDGVINTTICGVELKLIRSESVVLSLKNDEHENIIKAESQHLDLLPAVYEGGLKMWECSYDLIRYLLTQSVPLEGKKVLDLGCGAGVVGITAFVKGSVVHFQDYNTEVVQLVTIPNLLLNVENRKLIKERAEFYSGDWAAFTELSFQKYPNEADKYDVILSSETIYNSENQQKLYEVFKRRLKPDGVGYVAAKTYYFGVGGGMRQFETLVVKDNTFDVEHVWRSEEGLQREIIKLVKRKQ